MNREERDKLFKLIIKHEDLYSNHKYDLGLTKEKFQIKLKPNAELRTQRPSKVPLHYREIVKTLLETLQQHGIIQKVGNPRRDEMGS